MNEGLERKKCKKNECPVWTPRKNWWNFSHKNNLKEDACLPQDAI